ncbi:hypothetical protein [Photobacterium phosphoreum]|uniref:hypothetical protein n=1 Tax=Photobacterium phosphoreum TaxID=659 RepID=UPI000D17FED6|nr:hypothetical protein [Photobacterium phosphoreum]PSU32163.1 hypothetical protein CTM85_20200 [Photobacterium phosphoreum]
MKIKKDSKIEFRCSSAFKAMIEEIAKAHNVKMSDVLEQACTELVAKHLPAPKLKSDNTRVKKSDKVKKRNGSNTQVSTETKKRLFESLDNLGELPTTRGQISMNKISELTGVGRSSVSKYLDEYLISRKLK